VDELTGLPDRGESMAWLEERARDSALTVALLDIDAMNSFNEAHGVVAGDFLLQALAHQLRGGAGPGELAARFGGEEFLLGWSGREPAEAAAAVEQLCADFTGSTLELADGTHCSNVTLSAGIAGLGSDSLSVDEMLGRADAALNAAKLRGGNCVEVFES
jgi:diguanylate cyclase (GGDEF)-like protein